MIYTPEQAAKYRECDELPDPTREHFGEQVQKLCPRKGTVLDMGCGTGRYFRYVSPRCALVGVDASCEMLREAKSPASGRKALALVNDTLEGYSPEPQGFDFVYSIGLMAEHISWTLEAVNKLFWLSTGKVYFTAEKFKSNKPTTITRLELEDILRDSCFSRFKMNEWETNAPNFKGTHFEVIAE